MGDVINYTSTTRMTSLVPPWMPMTSILANERSNSNNNNKNTNDNNSSYELFSVLDNIINNNNNNNISFLYDLSTSLYLDNATQCSPAFNGTGNGSEGGSFLCGAVNGSDAEVGIVPPPPTYSLWLTVFLGILAAVVSIVTVLGNMTVLLAFGLERSIRQPTNYFIASLAVSDLLIGTFSMPLFTQYSLLSYWPLGPWLCDLWLSLDWTVCLTSQYTVFFITMDRFLSIKIPAKYRSWRTERKVRVMVGITWVVPALIFFTTIIGWQYFVGERTVVALQCEVQFMSDPLFTFLLTIGYYWITLVVMCVLYGGIYKVALELQRKSDAKQRKLESTMELAADASRTSASGASNSFYSGSGGDCQKSQRGKGHRAWPRKEKKSLMRGKDGGGGGRGIVPGSLHNNFTGGSKSPYTASFSGCNNLATGDIPRQDSPGGGSLLTDGGDNKDDDRSSSPAFASDDEGSSSGTTPGGPGGGKSPKGLATAFPACTSINNNQRRSLKSSLNPKSGIAGIVNTAMLSTSDSFRNMAGDGCPGPMIPLPGILMGQPPSYSEAILAGGEKAAVSSSFSGTPMPPSEQKLKPSHGGPNYSRLDDTHPGSCADTESETEMGEVKVSEDQQQRQEEEEEQRVLLLDDAASPKGYPYIDEKSFLAVSSHDESQSPLPVPVPWPVEKAVTSSSNEGKASPLWKRRNSVPLPPLATSDVFDIVIDDEVTDCGITELTSTMILTSSCQLNGGDEMSTAEEDAAGAKHNATKAPRSVPPACRGGPRKGDGKLHSFVKSVRSRNSRRRNRRERKSKSENRARKALKTITIILGAFVLCWTPYHIMLFVIAMCKGYSCINMEFYNFTYWLCYLNSPINPFCYAFANAQFKRTFLRILRFDWHRT